MPAALGSGLRAAACSGLLAGTLATVSAQDRAPALGDLTARAGAYVQRVFEGFATLLGDERYEQQFVTGRALREPAPATSLGTLVRVAGRGAVLVDRPHRQARGRQACARQRDAPRAAYSQTRRPAGRCGCGRSVTKGRVSTLAGWSGTSATPCWRCSFSTPQTQPRFEFKLRDENGFGDRSAWRVSFKERTYPTLIRSNGRDVLASGDVWLADDDQAVLRTRVSLVDRYFDLRIRATIRVEYRSDLGSAFGCRRRCARPDDRTGAVSTTAASLCSTIVSSASPPTATSVASRREPDS